MAEHIYLAIGWILFCVLHSMLASLWFKKKMQRWLRGNYVYYRAFYSTFALITFIIVILQQVATSSPLLFSPGPVTLFIAGAIAFIGFVFMAISLWRYVFNIYGFDRLFGKQQQVELMQDGIHAFVRHPLYFGTFLFIWGAWFIFPWVSLLISNTIITVYTLIAVRFEEDKLKLEYGDKYSAYSSKTPMIFPKVRVYKK